MDRVHLESDVIALRVRVEQLEADNVTLRYKLDIYYAAYESRVSAQNLKLYAASELHACDYARIDVLAAENCAAERLGNEHAAYLAEVCEELDSLRKYLADGQRYLAQYMEMYDEADNARAQCRARELQFADENTYLRAEIETLTTELNDLRANASELLVLRKKDVYQRYIIRVLQAQVRQYSDLIAQSKTNARLDAVRSLSTSMRRSGTFATALATSPAAWIY